MESSCNSKHSLEDQEVAYPNKKQRLESDLLSCNKPTNNPVCDKLPSNQNDPSFKRASENDVGITEYISDLPGFNAVIKERYSDFIVNEIDTEGNVVRLTSLEKPKNPERDLTVDGLIDYGTIKSIEELLTNERPEVEINVTDKDKDTRKDIHVTLRKMFSGVESSTEDRGSEKFIIVKKFAKQKKHRRCQLSSLGNYLQFVLYKENKDTMDAINCIASYLKVNPKIFGYAGSKDKRGKTSQLVSAYQMSPERLLKINDEFNMVRVGNMVYKNQQLKLGDLKGNRFVIILRQLQGDPIIIGKAIDSLSTKGFINYYGLQRFGTSSVPTHCIGRLVLRSQWGKAINLLLTPGNEGDDELLEAKRIWTKSGDANLALKNLKRKSSIEAKLLNGIASSHKRDYCNAFGAIPRNMRLMYLHSYQSYIWNKVASKRIKKYGLKVLKGDLVSQETSGLVDNCEEVKEESTNMASLESLVKAIGEDEVDQYDISDVLLPLPGHRVVFPDNETKDWYSEFLKEDGMEWKDFDSKVKANSLSGAYRKLIVVPKDIKWEIIPYSDVTQSLVLSDLDMLQGLPEPTIDENGSLKALKLEFQLPSSAYATMAIREISKQSTCYVSPANK